MEPEPPLLELPLEPAVPVEPEDPELPPAADDPDEPEPIDAFDSTNSLPEPFDDEDDELLPEVPVALDALAGCRQPVNVTVSLLLRLLLPSCPEVCPDDDPVDPEDCPAVLPPDWAETPTAIAAVRTVPKINCRFIQNLLGHRYPKRSRNRCK
jgi:hypothetical protein